MSSPPSHAKEPRSPRLHAADHSTPHSISERASERASERKPLLGTPSSGGGSEHAQQNGYSASPPLKQPLSLYARTAIFMSLWYLCSGGTLFSNKHIMTTLHADPSLLAMCQMSITALFGFAKMYGPWLLGLGPGEASPLSTQAPLVAQLRSCRMGCPRTLPRARRRAAPS